MIYMWARAIPRVDQWVSVGPRRDYFEEFLKKLPLEKADGFVSFWLERGLRNLKVVVLKLDNLLTKHLQSFRTVSQAKNSGLFKDSNNSSAGTDSATDKQVENKQS